MNIRENRMDNADTLTTFGHTKYMTKTNKTKHNTKIKKDNMITKLISCPVSLLNHNILF